MSLILLLGGYGGFGSRIARRLASAGHEVLVAGRSIGKARAVCANMPGLIPLAMDRSNIEAVLAEHRPAILVDASGPFQTMDYAVPNACIAAGVHYLDIADGREFVCGIGGLDEAAKARNVVVLSGASSVPALSGAAVRHLAQGMEQVRAVEMAISASNRATAGPSVAAAILGQAGRPVRIWRGRRWTRAFGWQEMKAVRFECEGTEPISDRLVALVDVPDLELLPKRLPGCPAVTFRAGTELGFQNRLLWLASWAVRSGLVGTLAPLARWLGSVQSLVQFLGSDRSAMIVRVSGEAGRRKVERRWTLIANNGDGPEIPTLSVVPIVARILAGVEPVGARDAGEALALVDYSRAFGELAIHHETRELPAPAGLYERVMGSRYASLPHEVRSIHDVLGDGGASGQAQVTGASNWMGALIARVMGFPNVGDHQLHVRFEEADGCETWTRDFGTRRFRSHLSQKGSWLIERFGPLRFAFDLPGDNGGLTMIMRGWWIGPIPLPKWLAPRSTAREWAQNGRFHFDVPIELPLVGRIVHYRGWLEIVRSDLDCPSAGI